MMDQQDFDEVAAHSANSGEFEPPPIVQVQLRERRSPHRIEVRKTRKLP